MALSFVLAQGAVSRQRACAAAGATRVVRAPPGWLRVARYPLQTLTLRARRGHNGRTEAPRSRRGALTSVCALKEWPLNRFPPPEILEGNEPVRSTYNLDKVLTEAALQRGFSLHDLGRDEKVRAMVSSAMRGVREGTLSPAATASLSYSISKFATYDNFMAVFDEICEAVVGNSEAYRVDQLVKVLSSLGKARHRHEELGQLVAARAAKEFGALNGKKLSVLLWALATLDIKSDDLFETLESGEHRLLRMDHRRRALMRHQVLRPPSRE